MLLTWRFFPGAHPPPRAARKLAAWPQAAPPTWPCCRPSSTHSDKQRRPIGLAAAPPLPPRRRSSSTSGATAWSSTARSTCLQASRRMGICNMFSISKVTDRGWAAIGRGWELCAPWPGLLPDPRTEPLPRTHPPTHPHTHTSYPHRPHHLCVLQATTLLGMAPCPPCCGPTHESTRTRRQRGR